MPGANGSGEVNLRVSRNRLAGFDRAQHRQHFPLDSRRVDALACGQVSRELPQSLAQLAHRAHRIPARMMIESDGYMNQRLQEQPPRAAFGRPSLLQHFVALEIRAAIEQGDAADEQRIGGQGLSRFGNCSSSAFNLGAMFCVT